MPRCPRARRTPIVLLTLTAAAVTLAGCGPSSSPAQKSSSTPETSASAPTSSAPPGTFTTSAFAVPFSAVLASQWRANEADQGLVTMWPDSIIEMDAPVDVVLTADHVDVPAAQEIQLLHDHAGSGAGALQQTTFAGQPATYFLYDPGRKYVLTDGKQACTADSCFHGLKTDHLRVMTVDVKGKDLTVVTLVGDPHKKKTQSHAWLMKMLPEVDQATATIAFR